MIRSLAPLAAATLLAVGASQALAAPTYRIKELKPTADGWASQALAINDKNVVVGWVQLKNHGPQVAAVWESGGGVTLLGTLPGTTISFATAVNKAGQIVGYSGTSDQPQAFIWDAVNGMQPIGAYDPAHPISAANGISEDGTVVGQSAMPDGTMHAFTWTPATGLVDPFPTQAGAVAYGINLHDQWVGGVTGTDTQVGVRVNVSGGKTDLGFITPDVPYAYGKAVNNPGDVVGSAGAVDGSNHAFKWDKLHGMQDLGVLPGGFFSNALAINDGGQVVGVSDIPQGRGTVDVPFYYDKRKGMVELTTLIAADDPFKPLVQFDAAQGVNNRGMIIANGVVTLPGWTNTRYRGFVLIPIDKK